MIRTFEHDFIPRLESPILSGQAAELDVTAIEDAGVREVLQTPGAVYGAWSVLAVLLEPTGPDTPFLFREPLGQAREVKVALSGLFGRFVARAYLERYFGLSLFAHLGSSEITLDAEQVSIVKTVSGDLPDWVAGGFDPAPPLTVAEAKGSHDPNPSAARARAWTQAQRIDVVASNGVKIPVKRIAIATSWGAASNGDVTARMAVHDPIDEGEPPTSEQADAIFIGLLRRHIAGLINPLGHDVLATTLLRLTAAKDEAKPALANEAHAILRQTPAIRSIDGGPRMIGGLVTRAGPLVGLDVSDVDYATLSRLELRPLFVGVDRTLLKCAIDGYASDARKLMSDTSGPDEAARSDRAGGWIIPLGQDRRRLIEE